MEVEQKEALTKDGTDPSVAYIATHPGGGHAEGAATGPAPLANKQLICWYCDKSGHRRHECRKLAADKKGRRGGAGRRGRGTDKGPSGAVAFTATENDKHHPVAAQAKTSNQSEECSSGQVKWIVDSGASHPMKNNSTGLSNYILTPGFSVALADGKTALAESKGTLYVTPKTGVPVTLEEVLYLPGFADSLLSVRTITRRGGSVQFVGDTCEVHSSSGLAMTGIPNPENQYEVEMVQTGTAAVAYGQAASETARLWHRRYCHLGADNLHRVSTLVEGMAPLLMEDVSPSQGALCHPYVKGRMLAKPFQSKDVATTELELLHMDLVGPLSTSLGNSVHFVTVQDDATELVVASTIKTMSAAGPAVRAWIAQLELQSGARIKRVRCDGAGELVSAEMRQIYGQLGIRLEPTAAHTSQQNGKAERLIRTLMERVRSFLAEAGLRVELWAEALMAVIYARNRAHTSDGKSTPFERFSG